MADLTASTALRDFIAGRLTSSGGCYMWATLHSSTAAIAVDTVYASSGLNELSTAAGYTAGGKTCGTISVSSGVLDTPNVEWTTGSGETLTAACACLWMNSSNDIVGAALVSMEDNSQTASDGGKMTFTISDPITIPTPT